MSSESKAESGRRLSKHTAAKRRPGPEANIFIEDGWAFSASPGKPVECLGRDAEWQGKTMAPPNHIRHHYPSN